MGEAEEGEGRTTYWFWICTSCLVEMEALGGLLLPMVVGGTPSAVGLIFAGP